MKIGIIGIGKLGLPFALNLESAGHEVIGVDISEEYVNSINEKTLKSDEPYVEILIQNSINFKATTTFDYLLDTEIVFLLVPTPSLSDGTYDHSYIENALTILEQKFKNRWQFIVDNNPIKSTYPKLKDIVIGCTTMPGYCDSIASNYAFSEKIRISYNPEFIAQGTIIHDQQYPDMILIGEADEQAGNIIEKITRSFTRKHDLKVCRMTRTEAEITKLALNCFLTTKIAYANMVGDIAIAAKARPDIILNAIGADSRIGHKYLKYGFGFGGPCFPRDNRAFGIFANSVGIPGRISEATDISNKEHLEHLLDQHNSLVQEFEYLTYKPESTLLTESHQLKYAQRLSARGVKVIVHERPSVIEELKKDPLNSKFIYEQRNF